MVQYIIRIDFRMATLFSSSFYDGKKPELFELDGIVANLPSHFPQSLIGLMIRMAHSSFIETINVDMNGVPTSMSRGLHESCFVPHDQSYDCLLQGFGLLLEPHHSYASIGISSDLAFHKSLFRVPIWSHCAHTFTIAIDFSSKPYLRKPERPTLFTDIADTQHFELEKIVVCAFRLALQPL
ncbi:hypothetical protein RvY_00399 [Ramazzottius varieornatus]|uniref:Uncharacterized protein n=1 Tax=Ramazzottius varieornatus TaxID=947166 RepID=A0A1D1UDL2_RAMVA|nr:hypothetical protein RvY_00399 [Ramazzottius varieornatus]